MQMHMSMEEKEQAKAGRFFWLMTGGVLLLVLGMLLSVTQGAATMPLNELVSLMSHYDATEPTHVLIMQMRIPRILAAALVGASLSVAGALMQGLTRNPMADSGLMGLSSGAVFMVALSYGFFHGISYSAMVGLSFFGAAFGAASVYAISLLAPGGNQPMKLILAGATMTSLLSALSQGISILTNTSQNVSFWTMGSVSAANWNQILFSSPVVAVAMVIAILIAKPVTLISMGDEVARSLGVRISLTRWVGTVLVVILSGISVSMAGLVSFVGIIIPHFSKIVMGHQYKYILPLSMIYGALLLVLADIGSKSINPPAEIPIGAIIAVIGVPIFLGIAKRKRG